jgi:hypothetical protein
MHENFRTYALKATALLGVFSFIYPAVITVRALLFKTDGGALSLLLASILMTAGFFIASAVIRENSAFFSRLASGKVAEFILDKHATALFLSGLVVHIAALVPAAIAAVVFQRDGIFRAAFEAIAALIFYIVGVRARYGEFDDILNRTKLYGGIIAIAISTAICSFSDIRLNFIFYAYILTVTSMIVFNQAGIDSVFLHMNRRLAGVSKDIRKFNIFSVLTLFGITLLFLNLKGIIVFFLNILNNVVRKGIVLFLRALEFLFSRAPETDGIIGQAQPPQLPDLGDESGMNPVADLILKGIFIAIFIYLIYKALPVILRAVRKVFQKVWMFVLNILRSTDKVEPEEEDYNDEIVEIKPVKNPAGRRKKSEEKLRRSMRGLKKIANPAAKVRYIYGMILDVLNAAGIGVARSDTPGEICRKAGSEDISIEGITKVYEKVRYGDVVPDAKEMDQAEACLSTVMERLSKANRKPR